MKAHVKGTPDTGVHKAASEFSERGVEALGHIALLSLFGTFTVWYLVDSVRASARTDNLLLVGPTASLALLLILCLLGGVFIRMQQGRSEISESEVEGSEKEVGVFPRGIAADTSSEQTFWKMHAIALSCVAILAYVPLLGVLGFDIATILFIAVGMFLQGERRPVVLVGFAFVAGLGCTVAMKLLIPVNFPTLLLEWMA